MQISNLVLGFILLTAIAKNINISEFGFLIFFQSSTNAVSAVFGNTLMLMQTALSGKYKSSRNEDEFNYIFKQVSVCFVVLSIVVSSLIIVRFNMKWILIASITFLVIDSIYQGKYLVQKNFKNLQIISLNKIVCQLMSIIFLVLVENPFDYIDPIGLYATVQILPLIYNLYIDRHPFVKIKNSSFFIDKKIKAEIIDFTHPAILGALLGLPILWFGNVLILHLENGASVLGALGIGLQLRTIIGFIQSRGGYFILPRLAELSLEKKIKIITIYNKYLFMVGIFFSGVLVYYIEPIIGIIYDKSLSYESYIGIKLILVATIIGFCGSGYGQLIQSQNLMWNGLIGNFIWAVTYIFTLYIMINKNPYYSIGLGLIFGAILNLLWTGLFLRKIVPNYFEKMAIYLLVCIIFLYIFI